MLRVKINIVFVLCVYTVVFSDFISYYTFFLFNFFKMLVGTCKDMRVQCYCLIDGYIANVLMSFNGSLFFLVNFLGQRTLQK